jgi:hypothetical protein
MIARRLFVLLALLSVVPAARAQRAVQSQLTVHPDTVTVGQPFTVTLRVQAPVGATIVFPAGPDSAAAVQQLDPRTLATARAQEAVDRTATYRLAAWDVGTLNLALADVVVHAAGGDQRVSLRDATVFVRSVLPADTALRKPKPARDIFTGWAFPWWVLAVLAAIAVIAWLARRRRRRGAPPVAPLTTPFERAEREFTRVAALGLVEAGERGRYVSLMVEVLRDYLWARFPMASLSLTTPELLHELTDAHTIPHDRLAALLHEADMIKFARRVLTTDRALELGREAREIVTRDHVASTPVISREAA